MKRVVQRALDQPLVIALGTLLFVLAGLAALARLHLEVLPDTSDLQLTVIALYPGHAAEDVERQLTLPIETALSALPHALRVQSHTQPGLSFTVITCDDAAQVQNVRQQAEERLRSVELPPHAQASLAPDTTPAGEILRYRLRGEDLSATALREIEDGVVQARLRQVPGVADVVTMGGALRQYEVQPDLDKLRAARLGLQQLLDALGRGGAGASGGNVAQGAQQYAIHGLGLLRSADDIGRIVVSAPDAAAPVLVRDVAHVEIGTTPRLSTVGQDLDDDVVTGVVVMHRGEDAGAVLTRVKQRIAELNGRGLPAGVQIVPFYDRSTLLGDVRATLLRNLAESALLVALALCLFFRDLRAGLAVAALIPLALLAACLGLALAGVPASLWSLGAIDFGILVGGAAIVVENILRRWRETAGPLDRDAQRRTLVEAAAEVGRPTLFAMLILIAAQIPILALQRQEGRLFRPMVLANASALALALVFAVALAPLLAALLLRRPQPRAERPTATLAQRLYAPVLEWALNHRREAAAVALGACALGLLAASRLGSEFMPELDEGSVWIHLQLPSSVSTAEAARMLHQVRQALLTVPEVRTAVSKAGRPESGTDPRTISMAEVFVDLKPRDEWRKGIDKQQLIDQMDRAVSALPGMAPTFSQPVRDSMLESISQTDGQLVIRIAADDEATLRRVAESVEHEIKQVRGVSLAGVDREGNLPQLAIDIDRERTARAGLNANDVQDMIEMALAGKPATLLWEGGRKFPVVVRLPESRRNVAALGSMPIPAPDGSDIPLAAVADIRETSAAMDIAREAGRRTLAIGVFIKDRDMGSVVRDMQARVARKVRLPAGCSLAWSGEFENQARAMASLALVAPVSLLLVFVLLLDALRSLPMAMLALSAVPLSLAGGSLALWAAGMPLSVGAVVGFIVLAGQALLCSVLMLSSFQALRNQGLDPLDAARTGALRRLDSVLMATALAMAGLLPMALSRGAGAEALRPLAVVMIGGLFTATLLALLLLPAFHLAGSMPRAAIAGRTELVL